MLIYFWAIDKFFVFWYVVPRTIWQPRFVLLRGEVVNLAAVRRPASTGAVGRGGGVPEDGPAERSVKAFLRQFLRVNQGCQMVHFQTKNPNLSLVWRAFEWTMFIYFMTNWSILWPFGIIYGHLFGIVYGHLVYFYILVCFDQENLATLVSTLLSDDRLPWKIGPVPGPYSVVLTLK
jgi:hypothetical protein